MIVWHHDSFGVRITGPKTVTPSSNHFWYMRKRERIESSKTWYPVVHTRRFMETPIPLTHTVVVLFVVVSSVRSPDGSVLVVTDNPLHPKYELIRTLSSGKRKTFEVF